MKRAPKLLDSKAALQALGLWDPASGHKPNHRYLHYLNERDLLARHELGPRTFRYALSDCERLVNLAATTGISLTQKA